MTFFHLQCQQSFLFNDCSIWVITHSFSLTWKWHSCKSASASASSFPRRSYRRRARLYILHYNMRFLLKKIHGCLGAGFLNISNKRHSWFCWGVLDIFIVCFCPCNTRICEMDFLWKHPQLHLKYTVPGVLKVYLIPFIWYIYIFKSMVIALVEEKRAILKKKLFSCSL